MLDMKKQTILLILLLLVISNFGQDLVKVKGEIQLVSYYQGGMELPEEYKKAKPNLNKSLIIVKYNGANEYSTYVTIITSDSNGHFEIELPKGKYGFVTINQKSKIKKQKGLYLPVIQKEPITDISAGEAISDYWSLNSGQPFEVGKNTKGKMIITHYHITICYLCP
jgi:hypothetical protein